MPANVLAIDTSTSRGGLAVVARSGELIAEESFIANRSHNSEFVDPLGRALAGLVGHKLDRIVVGTGPGSYTGIRIGISAAIGVAVSRDARLAGLPSVCAVAEAVNYSVVGDARRGAVYIAEVKERVLVGAPRMVEAEEFEKPPGLVVTFDGASICEGLRQATPEAAILAEMAAGMSEADFEQLASTPVEPIYLRAPFVTEPKKMGKTLPGAPA
ncbi:MAG: tRNA (adenosine(37)-N6)-threonylcarbamoyltransferase complex dimerization subunit type 1 TsaB [Verrucomicrobiota bacterium]